MIVPKKTLKILLVDDDIITLRLLESWLLEAGYQVRLAIDGCEALAFIDSESPDIIIANWEMPNINGLELCRRIRERREQKYIYFLLLSSKSSAEEMSRALLDGADDYIRKPLNRHELLARLQVGVRALDRERRLSLLADTDSLTGLMTQRSFYEKLQQSWSEAQKENAPLSCAMIDLDFFKRINDVHGHPTGDSVLKFAAELLKDHCRANDTLCRYGGEEFCVILPGADEKQTAQWAERIRSKLGELQIPLPKESLRITGSIGVAQRYDDTNTPGELIDQADQALLCAKWSGRDRVVRFDCLHEATDLFAENGPPDDFFQGMEARHVMTSFVINLRESETVGQAAEFFLRSRISSAPVVDASGLLVGILSEKDVMAAMTSRNCWSWPLSKLMRPHVVSYTEDTPVRTIYDFLCRVAVRRIVIVREGRPVGTVSRASLLRWFRNIVFSQEVGVKRTLTALPEHDPHRAKERLKETAHRLSQEATRLAERFHDGAKREFLTPHVVGSASNMQELVCDLLAFSRYADERSESREGQFAAGNIGSCVE